MPMSRRRVFTGDNVYTNPWVGPADHPAPVPVDPANLTADEVDADGYVKPGVPFQRDGTLLTAAVTAGEFVYGATFEPVKVAEGNTPALLAAADVVDVTVQTHGQMNRAEGERNIGRAYTAGELAAFDAAGSNITLIF